MSSVSSNPHTPIDDVCISLKRFADALSRLNDALSTEDHVDHVEGLVAYLREHIKIFEGGPPREKLLALAGLLEDLRGKLAENEVDPSVLPDLIRKTFAQPSSSRTSILRSSVLEQFASTPKEKEALGRLLDILTEASKHFPLDCSGENFHLQKVFTSRAHRSIAGLRDWEFLCGIESVWEDTPNVDEVHADPVSRYFAAEVKLHRSFLQSLRTQEFLFDDAEAKCLYRMAEMEISNLAEPDRTYWFTRINETEELRESFISRFEQTDVQHFIEVMKLIPYRVKAAKVTQAYRDWIDGPRPAVPHLAQTSKLDRYASDAQIPGEPELPMSPKGATPSDANLSTTIQHVDQGPYSGPKPPKDWCKIFKLSWDTLKKRFDTQAIKNIKINNHSYRVLVSELPPEMT